MVPEPGSRRRVGAMAEEGKVRIEKFDGKDFRFWKMQIEDYLYQKKLHEPLSGKKPEKMKQTDWDLLDRQTLRVVRLTLARNVAFNIVKEKITTDLMKALSNMCEKPSAPNKITFEDEVKALILLLSLPESWSATVTAVSSLLRSVKLKMDDI